MTCLSAFVITLHQLLFWQDQNGLPVNWRDTSLVSEVNIAGAVAKWIILRIPKEKEVEWFTQKLYIAILIAMYNFCFDYNTIPEGIHNLIKGIAFK